MAFTADQKAQIRLYMGMSRLFINSNPILESAITAIENLNDGGATETRMVTALTNIAAIETSIGVAQTLLLASEVVGEVKIDAARQIAVLRSEGQKMINQISIPLSMPPFIRYFYARSTSEAMDFMLHGEGNSRLI